MDIILGKDRVQEILSLAVYDIKLYVGADEGSYFFFTGKQANCSAKDDRIDCWGSYFNGFMLASGLSIGLKLARAT